MFPKYLLSTVMVSCIYVYTESYTLVHWFTLEKYNVFKTFLLLLDANASIKYFIYNIVVYINLCECHSVILRSLLVSV